MPAAIVKLVGNYDRRPSEQRVKWIGDLYFASQIPGIMTPRRTKGRKTGRCSPRWLRPVSCTASIPKPI